MRTFLIFMKTNVPLTILHFSLVAQTTWVQDTLGLTHELQAELAFSDEGLTLDQYINLTIRIDNLHRARRLLQSLSVPFSSATGSVSDPIQLGHTHLSPKERENRH